MNKKTKNKPKSVEEELKQVQQCLKNKDKRIGSLERANKDAEENKEFMIQSFNFCGLVFFIIAMFVFVLVCHTFYPDWFATVAPHFAIIGTFTIVFNAFIGCAFFIFDIDDDVIALVYIVFNLIGVPIIIVFYWLIQAMIYNIGSS